MSSTITIHDRRLIHRRGFSLVEMLTVITVGSAIVGMAVSVLHVLFRADETGRQRLQRTSVSFRLAEQFRNDMAAVLRPATGEGAEWKFMLPDDRTVSYRAIAGGLDRDEHRDGKLLRHETYRLPDGCSATITVEQDAAPATATLVIEGGKSVLREIRVSAPLGKDHRFSKRKVAGTFRVPSARKTEFIPFVSASAQERNEFRSTVAGTLRVPSARRTEFIPFVSVSAQKRNEFRSTVAGTLRVPSGRT